MIGLVLLQKSEGGGLGMGGGGGGFLTSRGTANVLTRTTAILAALFFATSLFLSILAGFERKPRSILDGGGRQRRRRPAQPAAPARSAAACSTSCGGGPPAGASRPGRAAGAATVKHHKGRETGPSLLAK